MKPSRFSFFIPDETFQVERKPGRLSGSEPSRFSYFQPGRFKTSGLRMSFPGFLSFVFRPDETFQVGRKPGRLSGKDLPVYPFLTSG